MERKERGATGRPTRRNVVGVKRTASTQVVQSASPRPGSAKRSGRAMRATRKGIAIPGDRRSGVDKERREKDPRQATEGQNGSGARRSWKGQGGSAVHHKRSSGTFTGEGGESLPRFFYGRANRSIAYFPHSAPRGLTYYNSPLVCGGARSAPYRSNALRLKEPRE